MNACVYTDSQSAGRPPRLTVSDPINQIHPQCRYYVDRMVSSVEGMKVLLLDEETTQIVSTVYSQVRA